MNKKLKEVAEMYGVSRQTVRRWVRDGLKANKTSGAPNGHLLINLDDVKDYLDGKQTQAHK